MHNWTGEICLLSHCERVHLTLIDVRTCNIEPFVGRIRMSAHDLPSKAKALSLVIAVALVATAFAPVLFTAARIVA